MNDRSEGELSPTPAKRSKIAEDNLPTKEEKRKENRDEKRLENREEKRLENREDKRKSDRKPENRDKRYQRRSNSRSRDKDDKKSDRRRRYRDYDRPSNEDDLYPQPQRYYGEDKHEKGNDDRHDEPREIGSRYYDVHKPKKPTPEPEKPKERERKVVDLLTSKTGGAYIPPAKLRLMQAGITDKSSAAYQRIAWEALKKSIHGHINKINTSNISIITKELLRENIIRGRGLICKSIIQAQAASPTFTNVYACLVAIINSRFPSIGELLLKRLILQFKRGFQRSSKQVCISAVTFVAHLVNQRVAHEILALEVLTLLVETPTDDSIEVAIAFLKEVGQKLTEVSSKGINAIFEMLRNILHEGQLEKRIQYMIEVVFQIRKDGFKDHAAVIEELDQVDENDQFTHLLTLDDVKQADSQDILNVFKMDDKYEENETKYKSLRSTLLSDSDDSDGEGGSGSGSGSGDEEDSDGSDAEGGDAETKADTIIDNTEANLIRLRRLIYLTIQSSLDFEECAHKLMKMDLKPGQEIELCHMFLDCCAEQRTYEKFYGLLAQRFCQLNRIYVPPFQQIFADTYGTSHRLDTNRLRNVSKFFAHLLFTDAIGWDVLENVKLNEQDTNSSSRIFIKTLCQELAEYMGLGKLNARLKDPTLQEYFSGLFPRDNPKNTTFSINFFTSIGLGGLTDELREHLKSVKSASAKAAIVLDADNSSSSSDSSSSDSDSSDSSSSSGNSTGSEAKKKKRQVKTSKSKGKVTGSETKNQEERDNKRSKVADSSNKTREKRESNVRRPEKQDRDKPEMSQNNNKRFERERQERNRDDKQREETQHPHPRSSDRYNHQDPGRKDERRNESSYSRDIDRHKDRPRESDRNNSNKSRHNERGNEKERIGNRYHDYEGRGRIDMQEDRRKYEIPVNDDRNRRERKERDRRRS